MAMIFSSLLSVIDANPVIAAVQDDKWEEAINGPSQVVFYLSANLLTIEDRIRQTHVAGKVLMVHIDLAEGIGKDISGLRYLARCGVDGIITTRTQMIRFARDLGLITVQRFFAVDSKGMDSINDTVKNSRPNMMEIMPGVIPKAIKRVQVNGIPVIAGGLIQNKGEVFDALSAGAVAVSTGQSDLWYL